MTFQRFFCSAVVLLLASVSCAEEHPPNVVLILADDLGFECLGANGGESYATPHLDELARRGLRFENCYATPFCTPSRVQLLTGRYGFRTGQVTARLDTSETTFAEVLAGAGYATAVAGKWKLCDFREEPDHPRESGFERYRLWTGRELAVDGKKSSRYWNPTLWENADFLRGVDGAYGPDLYCDYLIEFMTENRSEPFLAYYPMALVHGPARLPPALPGEDPIARHPRESYARMVSYMDHLVGRIVASLDELGIRENTLVLFTSDNGTSTAIRSRFRGEEVGGGKGVMSPAGFRVPLIASWPGTIEPGVVERIVDFSDFLPTLADLADARLDPEIALDGRSFLPALRGEAGEAREWAYVQCFEERCVVEANWRLHHDARLVAVDANGEEREFTPDQDGEAEKAARARLQSLLDTLQ